jgi:hypothetical protein
MSRFASSFALIIAQLAVTILVVLFQHLFVHFATRRMVAFVSAIFSRIGQCRRGQEAGSG